MEPLLEVKDLTKIFSRENQGKCTAVDHVSFRINPGETLGLVGESGCGKSTLARMILGLLTPTGGTVCLKGKDITNAPGKEWREVYRRIQMVFQSPTGSFDPRKTIGYGIGESLLNRGVPKPERRARIAELLGKCGLPPEYAGRYPHEISGGQCQRAAIARALAIQPELLICDEATSALDVTVQRKIMELLQALKQENGLSFLFICHDLALVQSFCDRVLVMHDGKITEEGSTEQIIRSPESEYTRRLVESAL